MITVYGIPNCDTVRKARRWLDAHQIPYRFHDLRKDGLDPAQLDHWLARAGWETLLNRRGATWRKLPEAVRKRIDAGTARQLMLDNPTLIKRPVVENGDTVLVGFSEAAYRGLEAA